MHQQVTRAVPDWHCHLGPRQIVSTHQGFMKHFRLRLSMSHVLVHEPQQWFMTCVRGSSELVLMAPQLANFIVFMKPWYLLDVLCRQPIKLFQVVSTSEFHEY